jgi:predicted NAD/FAD-binding protein
MSRRQIAVIGAGAGGLSAAYVLARADEVTLYEAEPRLGGHAHTHTVAEPGGTQLRLDTGFLVFNEPTYPLLCRLLAELHVDSQETEMSLSFRCAQCGLCYAGQRGLAGLAAGLRRGGTRYLRLLAEVRRFHREARRLLGRDGGASAAPPWPTFGEFLTGSGFSAYFITHFALPFVAAVWSCPPGTALSYPAGYLFRFLDNHGLLSVTGSPRWRTVTGGSATYVERVAKRLAAVRAAAPVTAVRRFPGGAEVSDRSGATARFDAVVIATHPDQALALLADATPAEREVLGAFRYTRNEVVLHSDPGLLPARPGLRASWNYTQRSCRQQEAEVQMSYYLNRLQRLGARREYVVTLNDRGTIAPQSVLARMTYRHPVYEPASVAAQRRLPELNDGVTAFAGAYHGWGFHEDAVRAGVAAARSLGGRW